MSVFVGIGIAWLIVTLVGHLTWVTIASVVHAFLATDKPKDEVSNQQKDVVAAGRVIGRLTGAQVIGTQEAMELRRKIDRLQSIERESLSNATTRGAQQASSIAGDIPMAIEVVDDIVEDALVASGEPVAASPIIAKLVQQVENQPAVESRPKLRKIPNEPPTVAAPRESAPLPAPPRVSMGKSLAEFLAVHNIRWGELIAGILIVVCSIGLVFSLWHPLTQMHRVIPSLIFLGGNAAIFGAGLYTLFRWRLEETSRATLVIATLLVPLSILAGLSTGGIDTSSVMLNDPVTILSIFSAGAIYITLLWKSGRALVGSANALPMTIGVAGPAAVLPFVPAAIRILGNSAGFITYSGSAAVAIAVTLLVHQRNAWAIGREHHRSRHDRVGGESESSPTKCDALLRGNASSRRALVIGVAGFSLAVLTGYVAFRLNSMDSSWRAIASSTLPGVVLLAAAAGSLKQDVKRPKLALAGSSVALCGLFAASALLVPMMASLGWLWAWALSFSIAAALSSALFRNHYWTVIASIPVGLACLLCSPAIAADVVWSELPVWKRFVGGEPMIASMIVAGAGFAISFLFRASNHCKAMRLTGGAWCAYATINAMILTFAPTTWMGVVPNWVLPALLGSAATACVAVAIRRNDERHSSLFGPLIAIITFAFWISVFKPLVIGQPFPGLFQTVMAFFSTAVCIIVSAECLFNRRQIATSCRTLASGFLFGGAAVAILLVLTPTDEPVQHLLNTQRAMITLGASVFAWLWIGLTDRNETHLGLSRLCMMILAIVVGHHFFHDSLMTVSAWQGGLALWAWAGLGWSFVAVIAVRNQLFQALTLVPERSRYSSFAQRFNWYQPADHPWDHGSRHLVVLAAIACLALASVMAFGSLVTAVGFQTTISLYNAISLPLCVLVAGGIALHLLQERRELEWLVLKRIHVIAVLIWAGWQTAIRMLVDPAEQLVTATSLATAGCFAFDLFRRELKSKEDDGSQRHVIAAGLLTAIGLVIVAVSSAALLIGGWCPAVIEGIRPDLFTTIAIAIWWTVGALTSGWLGHRHRSHTLAIVAAALVPATAILLMPLWTPSDWWVWMQTAAIASGITAMSLRWASHWKSKEPILQPTVDLSLIICVTTGLLSCIVLIAGILIRDAQWMQLHNPAGWVLALMAALLVLSWNRVSSEKLRMDGVIAWPVMITITSGHLAMWVAYSDFSTTPPFRILPMVWVAVSLIAIIESCRTAFSKTEESRFGRRHAGALIVAASLLCLFNSATPNHYWVGLIACFVGGVLATSRSVIAHLESGREIVIRKSSARLTRGLCWYVIVMGSVFAFAIVNAMSGSESLLWTMLIGWVGLWGLVWRFVSPDQSTLDHTPRLAFLADSETAVLLLAGLALEILAVMVAPLDIVRRGVLEDPELWVRLGCGAIMVLSVGSRHQRKWMIEVAVTTVLAAATLLGIRIGIDQQAEPATQFAIVTLVGSSCMVVFAFFCGGFSRVINAAGTAHSGLLSYSHATATLTSPQFANALSRVVLLPLVIALAFTSWSLVHYNTNPVVPLAICGIALIAASFAELAERTGREVLRHYAMVIGLASIGMWATYNVTASPRPLLTLSTRWFVGWVFIVAGMGFVAPKVLGVATLDRWRRALRSGITIALVLACGSLVATLAQEAMVRVSGQTDLLVKPLYIGMAATLAMMSLMSTFAGVLSGPGFSYRDAWQLTDRQRAGLIVAAQIFGGLTWFHLFLCKSPLASLGLRAYWPYIVMTLAFVSVGITEWARRRGDEVLTKTLKQTALFLPLIPVIGFWLSGSWVTSMFGTSDGNGWNFIQGRVSYQALLVAAALYYGVVSFLWKSGRARLVSILMANVALWVYLIQTPNWGFLNHPQAWLIPPAICVLIATHFQRKSLGNATASAIRYAATLTIYITSTADMLVQGIGQTLMGPMVLIVLALIGAAIGIAFRVRPFLYLGTTFVFLGVTSMVWHAQQRLDAVWPWWAFGISTGVLLMIGLMAIEKNKPKLKQIALSMQQWDS